MSVELYDQKKLSVSSSSVSINTVSIQAGKCLTNNYQITAAKLKEDVLTGNVCYELQCEKNKKYIEKINDILQKLPKLVDFVKVKPVIPEFDEIEVLKTDSNEIKKFIRKANYDFLGFHCNHKDFDKQYDRVDSEIAKLFESNEYKQYDGMIESFVSVIYNIIRADYLVYNKLVKPNKYDDELRIKVRNLEMDAKKIVDLIIKINAKVISVNANVRPSCPKCNATVRKYNYVLKEVQRMREELHEQEEIDREYEEKPAEEKFSMKKFMDDNYPTIERFLLSDVKEKYKKTLGVNLTIPKMKEQIEATNKFKVTNCKGKFYVSRL